MNRILLTLVLFCLGNTVSAQNLVIKEMTKKQIGSIANEDLNNDGYLDFVCLYNTVKIYYGTPGLDLKSPEVIDNGLTYNTSYTICKIADMNNDGWKDIVVNQLNPNKLIIYYNSPNGQFTKEERSLALVGNYYMDCSDLNADGTKDLIFYEIHLNVVGSYYNTYYKVFYIMNMNGVLNPLVNYSITLPDTKMRKFYDADGDGKIDFNIGYYLYSYEQNQLFHQNAPLTDIMTHSGSSYTTDSDALHADINADGVLDYIFINNFSTLGHSVTTNQNPFTSTNVTDYPYSVSAYSNLIQFEADSDVYPEFLASINGKVCLLNYNAATDHLDSTVLFQAASVKKFDLMDYNNDGFKDLIMFPSQNTSDRVIVALNNGSNAFPQTMTVMFDNQSNGGVPNTKGDINGDGLEDLVFFNNNNLVWVKNLGNEEYSNMMKIRSTYIPTQMDLTDIDNDSDLDLVVASSYYLSGTYPLFNVFYNDGAGNFSAPVTIESGVTGGNQRIADMNNDGRKDIILTAYSSSTQGQVLYYRNNPNGTFTKQILATQVSATKLPFAVVDWDGNGYQDVIILQTNVIKIFYNSGTSFSAATQLVNLTINYTDIKAVDLDNDGDYDFVLNRGGIANALSVVMNNAGTFNIQPYTSSTTGSNMSLTYMYYNNDSLVDILFTNDYNMGLLVNNGSGNFAPIEYFTMNEKFLNFLEIKNSQGIVTKHLINDFEGAIYSLGNFIPGNQPVLNQSAFTACPGSTVSVQVTNGTELNDNAYWGIFADSCSGAILDTSSTGLFQFSSNSSGTFYVKALGNGAISGSCSSFTMQVSGSTSTVDLDLSDVSSDYAVLAVNAPLAISAWEYQLNDNDSTWSSISVVADSITIPNLIPNMEYELRIRPAGSVDSCSNWETAVFNFHSDCSVTEVFDTSYTCMWGTYVLPNYQVLSINQLPFNVDYTLLNAYGCDSIVHLTLLSGVFSGTDVQTACGSYTWIDGVTYTSSTNTPTFVLDNVSGCDSTVTLNLTILNTTTGTDVQTACTSYTWINGVTYTSSTNTPTYVLQNAAGCDSVVTLHLTITGGNTGTDVQTSCGPYTWIDGTTYNTSTNTPTFVLQSAAGCDSTVTLNLTITALTGTDVQTSCGPYTWIDGITYNTSTNTPTFVLQSAAGCDSIVTLNLTILNSNTATETQTACGSYTWPINGQTYTVSGQYVDTIPNAAGCDSIITLDLTIIPDLPLVIENSFSMPSDANSCTGEVAVTVSGNAPFELDFDNGSQVITSGGYSLVSGLCAGIHDLHVTDNCGDTLSTTVVIPVDSNYVFNNPFIDSLAQDSLGVTMTNCDIYYAGIDTAYIDSIWANGNTVNVIWNIVDSNGSNFDTTSYVLNNGNGVYWLQLSVFCPNKSMGEYFTVTEAIYFNNGSVSTAGLPDIGKDLFAVFPNPTNDQVHISFSGSEAELTVYDAQGKMVLKDQIQNQGTVSLENLERGVYLFDFRSTQGRSIQRVVKQ